MNGSMSSAAYDDQADTRVTGSLSFGHFMAAARVAKAGSKAVNQTRTPAFIGRSELIISLHWPHFHSISLSPFQ